MKNLYTPLDEKTVRSLKLGEIVNITGPVVTGRDEVHIRALEYLDEGKELCQILYETLAAFGIGVTTVHETMNVCVFQTINLGYLNEFL